MNFLNKAKTSVSVAALEAHNDKGSDVATVDGNEATAYALSDRAIELAKLESAGMSAAIETAVKGKEDWQGGPIKVLFAMRDTYADDLASFPVPNETDGNNPDKFELPVTDSAGKTTMRKTSFYQVFSDNTKEGKAINVELEQLKRAGDEKAIKSDIPDAILSLTIDQRETRKNFLTGRRSSIKRSYHNAMALYHQMEAINGMPKVGIDFVWSDDTETEVANTSKPIIVWDMPAEGKPIIRREFFSIGGLLRLKVGLALVKGGNLKALQATVSRNTNGGAGNNEAPVIKNIDSFVGNLVETFRYLDEINSAADGKDLGKLYQVLRAKNADELKVTVVEFRNYLDDIAKEFNLDDFYTNMRKAKSDLVKAA